MTPLTGKYKQFDESQWMYYLRMMSLFARGKTKLRWYMPPRDLVDLGPRHIRLKKAREMLEVLEKETKQIIQRPRDEIALGSNLNATLALLPYLDLVWVKILLSICEFK